MPSLFSDIRGFFSAKFSGRYLALLLRELGRRDPKTFGQIFQLPKELLRSLIQGESQIEHEWPFETKNGNKRADIAVLKGGQPVLLIEIKEDDVQAPKNPTQIQDYLSVTTTMLVPREQQIRFVHVSRYALPDREQAMLDKASRNGKLVCQLRYRKIYEILKKSDSPIGRLIQEYLEDIDVATYEVFDIGSSKGGKPLSFLLTQVLGFRHASGLGKLHSDHAVTEFPKIVKILFGNLEVLAEWMKSVNRTIFRTRFTRKIKPTPYFNLSGLHKALTKKKASEGSLGIENELPGTAGQYINSGTVLFYAEGKITNPPGKKKALGPSEWLYVEVGYRFDISVGGKEMPPAIYAYASFHWNGSPDYDRHKKLIGFPTERKALDSLRECLKGAHKKAISNAPKSYKAALRTFRIPPAA